MEISPCSCTDIVHVVMMAKLPKVINEFSEIPIKIPTISFAKMENLSLKSIYGVQRGPKELKQYQKRTKHSSQKVETAYIFISEWTDNI